MKTLIHISIVLFCFALVSCEEEILIDYVDVKKYVVVNSTFSPQKEFVVNLSYSKNILDGDTDNHWVENAEIKVYRGDGAYLFTPEYVGEGNYIEHTFPIANQVYRLEVKVNGYPLITASSRIPTQAIVENVTTTDFGEEDEGAIKVDFEIQDSEDIDNYYIWEIIQGDLNPENTRTNLLGIIDGGHIESLQNNGRWSKLFIQELDFNAGISFLSYHDQEINSTDPNDPLDPNDGTSETEPYFLKVISASSDYYKNLLSIVELENGGQENGSSVVLSTQYHSNINGGLGIFAGYNEHLIEL